MSSLSVRFFLDNIKSKTTTIIKVSISYSGIRTKISIQYSIPVLDWENSRELVKASNPISGIINCRIAEIRKYANSRFLLLQMESDFEYYKFISEVNDFIKGKQQDNQTSSKNFFQLWKEYIEYKKDNGIFGYNTLKTNERAWRFIKLFNKNTTFDIIDEKYLTEFRTFLIRKHDYQFNGTLPLIKNSLFAFLNWAKENNYTNNIKYKKYKISETEKHHNVCLSLDELQKIKELDGLPTHLENTRNWLMLMCFSGLRISDALRLSRSNINLQKMEIEMIAQKTKSKIIIPITSPLKPYIEKLLIGEVYKVSEQKLNDNNKVLCKLAGIDDPITVSTFKLKKTEEIVPKHLLITNHCFRRTFATISLKLGLQPADIMKITGHKTLSVFEKYIGFTLQNAVDEVGKAWNKVEI